MTFGVLFSSADNFAQTELWRGIIDFAATRDIHLVAYMGSYQAGHTDLSLHLNTCFDTICKSTFLDGVILFSGFVSPLAGGDEEYMRYVSKIPPTMPCVSVSQIIPGMPGILADNIGGVHAAVDHLIKSHGKRRIAFITGPAGHREAEDRLIGYKRALADNGIAFDPVLILPGDFSQGAASSATSALLDKSIPFDALAASDDISAIAAIREMNARGLRVPDDVAVTGFNDDREAATFVPGVSTARQDFYVMGKESASALLSLINGKPAPSVVYVPSVFVPRQSCGCFRRGFFEEETNISSHNLTAFLREKLMPVYPPVISNRRRADWIATLDDLLRQNPFDKQKFLIAFDEILASYSHRSKVYGVWHDVINVCTQAVRLFPQNVHRPESALEALINATTLLNDLTAKETLLHEDRQNTSHLNMRRITGTLMLSFNIDTLAKEMGRMLPEININTALLGIYATAIKSNDPGADRTIATLIGFDGDVRFNLKDTNFRFSDIVQLDGYEFEAEQRTHLFMPLFFKEDELGALIVPYDPQIAMYAYDSLRINLSTAVKGAQLINTVQTLSITDELSGLYNRRGLLQFADTRMDFFQRNEDVLPMVMVIDLDGLKFINDTYGHSEGDRAIVDFAAILKDNLRKDDIISRVGGDEFVVLAAVKSEENAQMLIKRLRRMVDRFNNKKQRPYELNCSLGQVILEDATIENFETAMQDADKILYAEKNRKKKAGLSRG